MQRDDKRRNLLQGTWLPDPRPGWPWLASLMVVCDRLVFYRPLAEGEEELARFNDHAVCVGVNPLFDEDCRRIGAMMADVATHGEEFLLGQLSAMSGPGPALNNEVTRLIGQLRGNADDDRGEEAKRRRLNRARLLLGLAELHQEQDAEVARGIILAEARTRDLMGELISSATGEGTDQTVSPRPPLSTPPLLKAWFTLREVSSSPEGDFLACSADSWEMLNLEEESHFLVCLDLPRPAAGQEAKDWLCEVRAVYAGVLGRLAGLIDGREDSGAGEWSELAREWNGISGGNAGASLTFYLLEPEKEKKGKHRLFAVLSQG